MARWTDGLPADVYARLCNCGSVKSDLPILVNTKWSYYKAVGKDKNGFIKEDALVSVLEMLDCNGIDIELTADEYNELKEV